MPVSRAFLRLLAVLLLSASPVAASNNQHTENTESQPAHAPQATPLFSAPSLPSSLPTFAPTPAPELPQVLPIWHRQGNSYLLKPSTCAHGCPLVMVHHPHGRTASEMLERPHVLTLLSALLEGGAAVLLSNDAGRAAWGSPGALRYAAEVHSKAVKKLHWNGRTYAMGLSMGGLPALLSPHTQPYRVSAVILIDAKVNLRESWLEDHDPRFAQHRREISEAYGVPSGAVLPYGLDPLHDYTHRLPLLVIGSTEDGIVDFERNSAALLARAPQAKLLLLSGAHLSQSRFSPEIGRAVAEFVQRKEQTLLGSH